MTDCNCSMCSEDRLPAPDRAEVAVPAAVAAHDALTSYSSTRGAAKHLFCSVCGIKSFYVPRSHPDGYSVNARALDAGTVEAMVIIAADGRNWEQTFGQA